MSPSIARETSDIVGKGTNDRVTRDREKPVELASDSAPAENDSLIGQEREQNDIAEYDVRTNISLAANPPQTDEVDRPSPRARVHPLNIGFKWGSIIFQIYDIVSDWNLMVKYLLDHEWSNLAWTMAFVFIPSFLNIAISMRMYNQDVEIYHDPCHRRGPDNELAHKLLWRKYNWPIVLLLKLAPLFRSLETLKYARESVNYGKKGEWCNQKKYYKKMVDEDKDLALLRIIAILEAAPQLILQLAIMQKDPQPFNYKFVSQFAKIFGALVSLGWSITSFNINVRLVQPDKTIITKIGKCFQFGWHILVTVSRIISVSVAASMSTLYTCMWFLAHWLIMTVWILATSTTPAEFVRNRRREPHLPTPLFEDIKAAMFASTLGAVFFVTHVNFRDLPTCYRHTFYYALCFVENIVACYFWAHLATEEIAARWYFELLIILCIVPFVLGILFMIAYYKLEPIMKKQDLAISSNALVNNMN